MTAPSSPNPISLQDLSLEIQTSPTAKVSFNDTKIKNMINGGDTQPHSMSEWYDSYAGIGSDGEWGIATITQTDTSTAGGYAEAQISVNHNGFWSLTLYNSGTPTKPYENEKWNDRGFRDPHPDTYQVKWDQVSGDAPTNENMEFENTWYNLSDQGGEGSRFIYLKSTVGTKTGVFDVTIRQNGVGASEVTQRFDITATWDGDTVLWTTSAKSTLSQGVGGADLTGFRWNTDGTCDSTSINGTWLDANEDDAFTGTASNFEIKYTNFSGQTPHTSIGVEGDWYPLSSLRQMSYNAGGTTARSCSFTITVRKLNDPASEVACTVTMFQNYES